jgi:hypothetical protein
MIVTLIKYKDNYRITIRHGNGDLKMLNDKFTESKEAHSTAEKIAKRNMVPLTHENNSTYNYHEWL